HLARAEAHISLQKQLLEHGAKPNFALTRCRVKPPLCYAILEDSLAVGELLLQWGASPRMICDGGTPLLVALRAGKSNFVDLLIRYGADLNDSGSGDTLPLCQAIAQER